MTLHSLFRAAHPDRARDAASGVPAEDVEAEHEDRDEDLLDSLGFDYDDEVSDLDR